MTTERDALNYTPLHAFAQQHRISYNELCAAVRAALAVPPVEQQAAAVMVDCVPPATSRDKWFYEQGRLAERDPRTHAMESSQPAPPVEQQAATIPPRYVLADQSMDVDKLYGDLRDLWAEANAVDTVIGRPSVLMAKIKMMRDAIGQARNGRVPYGSIAVPEQPAPQAGAAEPVTLTVDLPERVVDVVAGQANLSGPFSERFYLFAQLLKDEVIARLPRHCFYPAAHPTEQPSQDAERWQFVLEHAVSGKAPKDKGFDITYVPVGHNGSEWGRIEIEWKGAKWERITADGVNAIIDAARAAQAQGESKGGSNG